MSQTKTINKEVVFPQSREEVWHAIADSNALSQWIYPNNFEARVGHEFTFQIPVPPNQQVEFDGTVRCKVLVCDPPRKLAYSWGGGGVNDTIVSFRLEPEGNNTRLFFEHSGFNTTIPNAQVYISGAEYGWNMMLSKLGKVLESVEVGQ